MLGKRLLGAAGIALAAVLAAAAADLLPERMAEVSKQVCVREGHWATVPASRPAPSSPTVVASAASSAVEPTRPARGPR